MTKSILLEPGSIEFHFAENADRVIVSYNQKYYIWTFEEYNEVCKSLQTLDIAFEYEPEVE